MTKNNPVLLQKIEKGRSWSLKIYLSLAWILVSVCPLWKADTKMGLDVGEINWRKHL